MSQRGIKVRRKLRLIDSLAIVCTGRQALTLLEIPWVIGIHPDAPVQVSGEGGPGKTE
jgi:topoisomerase IA-like protein